MNDLRDVRYDQVSFQSNWKDRRMTAEGGTNTITTEYEDCSSNTCYYEDGATQTEGTDVDRRLDDKVFILDGWRPEGELKVAVMKAANLIETQLQKNIDSLAFIGE